MQETTRRCRVVLAAAWLGLAMAMAACSSEQPVGPVPPEGVKLRAPQDMDGPWLDAQESKIRDVLKPSFGRVDIAEYRVPADRSWDEIQRHYDTTLAANKLTRHTGVPSSAMHYKLTVWTEGGKAAAPMVAVAQVLPAGTAPAVPHQVLLVITPRQD